MTPTEDEAMRAAGWDALIRQGATEQDAAELVTNHVDSLQSALWLWAKDQLEELWKQRRLKAIGE